MSASLFHAFSNLYMHVLEASFLGWVKSGSAASHCRSADFLARANSI